VYESFATVWELMADTVPDAPAVVQGERRESWREFEDRAARLASALAALGAGPGTHVALHQFNGPEYLEGLFACSKLRAVPVNVNFRYLGDELAYLLDNAAAEVVVSHRQLAPNLAAARDRLGRVRAFVDIDDATGAEALDGALDYEALLAASTPAPRIGRSGDDLLLWYTGGTTGLPKGVLWKQGTLLRYGIAATYGMDGEAEPAALDSLAADARRRRSAGRAVVPLVTSPLVHATAVHQANTACSVGGTVVLLERGHVDGDVVCATIQRERPTLLAVVGDTILLRIMRALEAAEARGEPYDLSSLRRIHNSGAMVSAETKDAILRRAELEFYDALGSSEAAGFAFASTRVPGESETARFRLGTNARLLDEQGRDVVPGSDTTGVLAVRGSISEGYFADPERDATTYRTIDGERHVVLGDHARLEADGTLVFLGRGGHCVNTGGEKVWPEEVEEALKAHPHVTDAAVIGIPDEEWGEIVAAVVALADGGGGEPPTADELTAWVAGRLAHYKRPRRIAVVAEVPRTTIGKLDYDATRALLLTPPS
jgi:fatty-acyl-CoA synthase